MANENLTLPSLAKINWFLRVIGRREDDYHEICTSFQTVSLGDNLSFSDSEMLTMSCNRPDLPVGESNLIIKAGLALKERFDVDRGALIVLDKRIPSPGGLGGGSSNAAVTLLGLAKLWELPATPRDLVEIGAGIGSDVAFFFCGGTALGTGRGTTISPVRDVVEKYLLIARPGTNISTQVAYEKLGLQRLTKKESKSILQICYDDAERLDSGQLTLFNDFENTVFQASPEIGDLKKRFFELGARNALMSGSGSSVFGVFDNEKDRQEALLSLSIDENVEVFAVETISRSRYYKLLEPCKDLLPKN